MSRTMLDVTLQLANGKTLKGRGRNLPATIGRIYNTPREGQPLAQVTLAEELRRGFVTKDEQRYHGTFHATLTITAFDGSRTQETVTVQVKDAAVLRSVAAAKPAATPAAAAA